MLYGKADKITQRFRLEDHSVLFRLGPAVVLMITKDHNSGLGMDGKDTAIPLDGEDTHGGNSSRSTFLSECSIFAERKLLVGDHVNIIDAGLLTLEPYVAFRMGVN